MNANDPLAGLRDIHLPPPVGWWPPAPGWWLLTLLGLAGLSAAGYLLFRYFRQRRYRRAALRELEALRRAVGLDQRQRLPALAELVRRVAIESCGRERVAPLSGPAWLDFLDRTGKTDRFGNGAGRVLGTELYRPGSVAGPELLVLVAEWIRRHKAELSGMPAQTKLMPKGCKAELSGLPAQTDKRVDETSRLMPKGNRPC